MTHNSFRAFVAIGISFVLLYYGIAWAVLRCSHDTKHSGYSVAVEDVDTAHQDFHHTSVNLVHLDLECIGPNFHTEAMAEVSSSPQLDRLMPEVTRHVNDFLTLQTRSGDAVSDLWLRAVFERSLWLAFVIGPPSYLFFSILRI